MGKRNGFSLVEMAIVLVILGLILSAAMGASKLARGAEQRRQAEQSLREIEQTLLAFAVRNGHLPCPALIGASMAKQGDEARDPGSGRCTQVQGEIPWRLLGLPRLDAWGRAYTYRVSRSFADLAPASMGDSCAGAATPPAGMSYLLCSAGDITVLGGAGDNDVLARRIPAIVISHGATGPAALSGAGQGDEQRNASVGDTFVARPAGSGQADAFDDVVHWLNNERIVEITLRAGRLP